VIQCVVFFLVDGDMGGLVLGLFGGFNRGVLGFVAGAGPFVSWLLGRASGWSGGSGVGAGFPCGIFWGVVGVYLLVSDCSWRCLGSFYWILRAWGCAEVVSPSVLRWGV